MKKRMLALGLVLVLCLSPAALAADPFFPKTIDMPAYTDVSATGGGTVWYDYQSVKTSVEAGLMKGTSGSTFEPGGTITLAEIATIAARINEKTTGYAIPKQEAGQAWYESALAVMAHIGVSVGKDPLVKATRADFVRILSAVLPNSMMAAINSITALPDTDDAAVLRFYNAGILTGKDAYGTFDGVGTLTRSESAAMLARIVNPDARKLFTPAGFVPSIDEENQSNATPRRADTGANESPVESPVEAPAL